MFFFLGIGILQLIINFFSSRLKVYHRMILRACFFIIIYIHLSYCFEMRTCTCIIDALVVSFFFSFFILQKKGGLVVTDF